MTLFEPSWDQAREAASAAVLRGSIEVLDINQCVDRVLSEDALSLVALPTYETSAMDGYVVAGRGPWKIIGEIKAGAPFNNKLQDGQALGIATGAVIPDGAFGVIRWENAKVNGDQLTGVTSARKDFRPAGDESKAEEVLVKAGTKLTPAMVGLLAAAGHDQLSVVKRPKIALLLFGDEIQLNGLPKDGLVRDSLGPQLPAWLEKLGCEVIRIEYVADELQLTIDAIKMASEECDLIATTGGTADGPRDFLVPAINALNGEVLIKQIACRPGHPQVLGKVNGKALLGLPGNPQSAVVALMTIGQPVINSLLGAKLPELPVITTDDQFEAQPGFTRLVLGNLVGNKFIKSEYLGSAMLRGLAHAQGFAICTNPPTSLRWLGLPL